MGASRKWACDESARFTHRTETMDYVIQLSGEVDWEFDGGEVVHLKAGDVIIQCGTTHTWINRGRTAAVTAFILIDAKPVEVNGPLAPARRLRRRCGSRTRFWHFFGRRDPVGRHG
jgi:uncharacterized cupin superfamily protein